MKLKNKKTGGIGELNYHDGFLQVVESNSPLCGNSVLSEYDSLDKLAAEWSDYEEPKGITRIFRGTGVDDEFVVKCSDKKTAEKIYNKMQAWKRLKDKGFKFTGINDDEESQYSCNQTGILCEINEEEKPTKLCKDKDFLAIFGGEG